MKKTISLMLSIFLLTFLIAEKSQACTNFLVTKGASKDGSTMITYSADSHTLYGELNFIPAGEHHGWKTFAATARLLDVTPKQPPR